MTARKPLRVVKPGEAPARRRKKSVVEAAAGGSLRELLVAMRERVATAVSDPNCPPRDLAALTRRLHELARDIEALDVADAEEAGGAAATPDEEWSAI